MRLAKIGCKNPMFGIVNPFKGKKHSVETKEKMKLSAIGRKCSKIYRIHLSESKKGEKNPNWNGGITTEIHQIRNSIEIRLWREAVFARDHWTCQKCKDDKGGNLRSHHIQNFSQYPELRFAIDNGITFCKQCHELFHKIYGTKHNNKGQLEKFLST
jgi:RNase P subunit RPR2